VSAFTHLTFSHAEWTKVGFSDESTIFIDIKSVTRAGSLVQVVELMNFPLGASSDDKKYNFKSSRTIEEFDCVNNLSRTISFEWFSETMGSGKRLYKDSNSYPYTKIVNGSLMESVKKRVCN
jgi:hypothetical protein